MPNEKQAYEVIAERLLKNVTVGLRDFATAIRTVEQMSLLRASALPVEFAHELAKKLEDYSDNLASRSLYFKLSPIAKETIENLKSRVDPPISS